MSDWKVNLTPRLKAFNIIANEFKQKWRVFNKARRKILSKIWKSIKQDLKAIVPIKSWKFQRSIKSKVEKWNELHVYTESKYAIFLEDWTQRHFIKPKNWKVLRWKQNWKWRFSKWHFVKWIRPGKYFERVENKWINKLNEIWSILSIELLKTR